MVMQARPHGEELLNAQGRDSQHDEQQPHGEEEEEALDEDLDHEEEDDLDVGEPATNELTIKISRSLYSRLKFTAKDEGISVDEFACELLAEGVTLRAWEIIERKSAMRGGNVGSHSVGANPNMRHNQQHQNKGNFGGGHNNKNNPRRGGGGHGNKRPFNSPSNMDLLQDKAAFLEYVRNQERKRR